MCIISRESSKNKGKRAKSKNSVKKTKSKQKKKKGTKKQKTASLGVEPSLSACVSNSLTTEPQ